jgi:hypothetical protein
MPFRDEESGACGRIYAAVERALWALGPALLLVVLLSLPSIRTAREQAETDHVKVLASENREHCTKWGALEGSPQFNDCIRDLVAIRGRAELHLLDQIADGI